MAFTLRNRPTRTAATASLAVAALLVAGCSSDDAADDEVTTTTEAAVESTTTTEADTDADADTDAEIDEASSTEAADGEFGPLPSWAREYSVAGDSIGTIEGEGYTVEILQLGTAAAPKDGMFVDPSNNESILKAGDEVVYVAYVVTNTSGATIDLPFNLVNVTARYADWQWAQGMDSVSDSALYEQFGVNSSAIGLGADAPFAWADGEVFVYGSNFKYQRGSEITFSAVMTPADAEGKLIHDDRTESELTTTIK